METRPFDLDSDNLPSDILTRKEIKEICREISARNLGKKVKPHQWAATVEEALRQEEDGGRETTLYPIGQNPYSEDNRRLEFSKAMERLGDKTQSLTSPANPHVTNRLTHTMRVKAVVRAIARGLGLNSELTEAIASGHDHGHVPFGHNGEIHMAAAMIKVRANILSVLGAFKHNVQSLHVVDRVGSRTGFEKGTGLNLTDQVRHGILSHDGEKDVISSSPDIALMNDPSLIQDDIVTYVRGIIAASTFTERPLSGNSDAEREKENIRRAQEAFNNANRTTIKPATLEGSVVVLGDVLTYCPEDFEDQVSLGVIRRRDLPLRVAKELGEDGATQINRLVQDVLVHSFYELYYAGNPTITYSPAVGALVNDYKRNFLYTQYPHVNSLAAVYGRDPRVRNNAPDIQRRFDYLFERFVEALKNPGMHPQSPIQDYMDGRNRFIYTGKMDQVYGELPDDEAYMIAAVMDYVAGFTDEFFFRRSDEMYR